MRKPDSNFITDRLAERKKEVADWRKSTLQAPKPPPKKKVTTLDKGLPNLRKEQEKRTAGKVEKFKAGPKPEQVYAARKKSLPKEFQGLFDQAVYLTRTADDGGQIGMKEFIDQKEQAKYKINPAEVERIHNLMKTPKGRAQIQAQIDAHKSLRKQTSEEIGARRDAGLPDMPPISPELKAQLDRAKKESLPVGQLSAEENQRRQTDYDRERQYGMTVAGRGQKGLEDLSQQFGESGIGQGLQKGIREGIKLVQPGVRSLPDEAFDPITKPVAEGAMRVATSPVEAITNLFGLIDPETPKGGYRTKNAVGLGVSVLGSSLGPAAKGAKTLAEGASGLEVLIGAAKASPKVVHGAEKIKPGAVVRTFANALESSPKEVVEQAGAKLWKAIEKSETSAVVKDARKQFAALGRDGEFQARKYAETVEKELIAKGIGGNDARKMANAHTAVLANALAKGQDPATALKKFAGFTDDLEEIGAYAAKGDVVAPPVATQTAGAKEPWEMTGAELLELYAKAEPPYVTLTSDLAGTSRRGQGKRVGQGQVVGGMAAAPRMTSKDYISPLNLTEAERAEVSPLMFVDGPASDAYLKWRAVGFDHPTAFVLSFDLDKGRQVLVKRALAQGKVVPSQVLSELPDLAKNDAWARQVEEAQLAQDRLTQGVKGAHDAATGKSFLSESADFSTLVHENGGHFLFEQLPEGLRKTAMDLMGETDEVMAHEKFSRLMEQYLQTGEAPTKSLKRIMGAMKGWMKETYGERSVLDESLNEAGATLRSEGLSVLDPKVKAFYDELVISPEELESWKALKVSMARGGQAAAQAEPPQPDDLRTNYIGASADETGTGARNVDMDAYRAEYGLPEVTRQPRHIQEVFDSAIKNGTVERAEGIANRVIKEGAGAFTAEEQAGVALAIGKTRREAEEALKATRKFAPDDMSDAAIMARSAFSEAEDVLNRLTHANRLGGSEWGLSGRIRQLVNDFKTDPILLKDRIQVKLGRPLTPDEALQIKNLQAELLQAKTTIADLEANAAKAKAGESVANARKSPRSMTRTVSTKKYEAIAAKYRQSPTNKLNQLTSDEWNDLSIITRYHLEEALEKGAGLDDISRQVKGVMPNVDEGDIINAIDAEARGIGKRIFRGKVLGDDIMSSGSAAVQAKDVLDARRQLDKLLGDLDKLKDAPGIDIQGMKAQVESLSGQMLDAVKARDFARVLDLQDELRSVGRSIASGKTYAEDFMRRGAAGIQSPQIRELRGVYAKAQNTAERFVKWADQEALKARSNGWQNFRRAAFRGMLEFRNLKASLDVSAAGRQGFILSMLNPKSVPKDFWRMLESGFSEKKYWEVMGDIEARPMFDKAQMGKVEFSGFDSITPDEEQAMATIAEGFKGWPRKAYDKTIGASNRMYSAYLNQIRMDAFENLVSAFEMKNMRPATIDELESIGNWVNIASGRGKLSENVKVGTVEQALFFAPRYNISRIQLLAGQPIINAAKTSPEVSKLIAQQYMKMAGGFVAVAGLMKAAGADIELDARSSDFGQGRWGNTRVDFSAGLRSYATLAARLMPKSWVDSWNQTLKGDFAAAGDSLKSSNLQGSVKTTRGLVNEQDRIKTAGRFAQGKLAPVPSVFYQVGNGKDFNGEPMTPGKALSGLVEPIILEQTREDFAKRPDDFAGNAARFGLNMLGVGSSYQDAKPGDPYADPTPELQLLIDYGLDSQPPKLSAQRAGESDAAYARRGELFKKNFERMAKAKREKLIRAVRRVMPRVLREKDPEKAKALLRRAKESAA